MNTSLLDPMNYGWELLAVYPYPDTSCDHKHCDSGDTIFLIFHMTSRRYFLTNFYFSPNDSPSKTIEDVFYFI